MLLMDKLYQILGSQTPVCITVESKHHRSRVYCIIEDIMADDRRIVLEWDDNALILYYVEIETVACTEEGISLCFADTNIEITYETDGC
ncbi:hypothetical protein NXH76_20520 [Blautia schinkii]|nr:hypothetical protein [Blautia schinkii]